MAEEDIKGILNKTDTMLDEFKGQSLLDSMKVIDGLLDIRLLAVAHLGDATPIHLDVEDKKIKYATTAH